MRVPLGVIGIAYNRAQRDGGRRRAASNPATRDTASGRELLTSLVIANTLNEGVAEAGLPQAAIMPTVDRAAVGFMLGGLAVPST